MKKRLLPGEYVYWDEIFPILIIGIAVNLVGSYLLEALKANHAGNPASYFSLGMLWQDTGGTAFVALALGPWWGAAAGVISSTLNTFTAPNFGDSFAYATVNVALGLAWGYVGRIVNSDTVVIAPKVVDLRLRAAMAVFAILLAGIVAATVVADLVKLSLLEIAGGDLFQGQPLYSGMQARISELGFSSGAARIFALFTLDFYENTLDKGLSLAVALMLVNAIGVIPSSHSPGAKMVPMTLTQRLRVSGDSIICFSAIYAGYILLGRLVLQRVHFEKSPIEAGIENWIKPVGVLLLFAFIVAYFAFIFGTLKSSRESDARVESNRLDREKLYGRIRKPKSWSRSSIEKSEYFSLFQQNSVYGVVGSLAAYPARAQIADTVSIWIYLFGMIGVSAVFFFERREKMELFRKALEWRAALKERVFESNNANSEKHVIPLLLDITGNVLTPASVMAQRTGHISYQVAINTATSGWLYEMRNFKSIDHLLLVAVHGHDHFDERVCTFVTKMVKATGIEAAVVVCMNYDEAHFQQLHKVCRTSNCYLIVLDAADLQDLIETRAQNEDVGLVFARRQVESRFVPVTES